MSWEFEFIFMILIPEIIIDLLCFSTEWSSLTKKLVLCSQHYGLWSQKFRSVLFFYVAVAIFRLFCLRESSEF